MALFPASRVLLHSLVHALADWAETAAHVDVDEEA